MSNRPLRHGRRDWNPTSGRHDTVCKLEMQVRNCEEIAEECITLLEDRYDEATTKSIRFEGQVTALQVRLQSAEGRMEATEEKATVIEVVAKVAKEEAA